MDKKHKCVLSGQARQIIYDVYSYIQNETKDTTETLAEVKQGICKILTTLFLNLSRITDSINNINCAKVDSIGLYSLLNDITHIVSEIKIETAENMKFRVGQLENTLNILNKIQHRTANATNISRKTIRTIMKESRQPDFVGKFKTPGTVRSRKKHVTFVDIPAEVNIKHRFNNSLQVNETHLTNDIIITILKEEINFQGSKSSLYRIVKDLGFEFSKTKHQCMALTESKSLCSQRIEYLQKIIKYRQEGRAIVYIDLWNVEPHILTKDKKKRIEGPKTVVCAASIEGILPNSLLAYSDTSKLNTFNNINAAIYEKWFYKQFIPNVPPMSVVVVDYSFHHRAEFICPLGSTKAEMQAWLTKNGFDFDTNFSISQLNKLIKEYTEENKIFSFERLLTEQGHKVVQLTKNLAELNPLKIAFYEIKQHITDTNPQCIKETKKMVESKMSLIESQQWKTIWKDVVCREKDYMLRHKIDISMVDHQNKKRPSIYQVFIKTEQPNMNLKSELTMDDDREINHLDGSKPSTSIQFENDIKMEET